MSPIGFDLDGDVLLRSEDYHWLMEQSEKVEYWRKQHRKRCNELEDAYFKIQLIEKQLHQAQAKAERYEKALEFYADEENYCVTFEDDYEPILKDNGKIARQALKGETK